MLPSDPTRFCLSVPATSLQTHREHFFPLSGLKNSELQATRRDHPHGSTLDHFTSYPRGDGPCRGFRSGRRSLPRLPCCAGGIRWPWPCTRDKNNFSAGAGQVTQRAKKMSGPPSETPTSIIRIGPRSSPSWLPLFTVTPFLAVITFRNFWPRPSPRRRKVVRTRHI